jgi:hypothetical protein
MHTPFFAAVLFRAVEPLMVTNLLHRTFVCGSDLRHGGIVCGGTSHDRGASRAPSRRSAMLVASYWQMSRSVEHRRGPRSVAPSTTRSRLSSLVWGIDIVAVQFVAQDGLWSQHHYVRSSTQVGHLITCSPGYHSILVFIPSERAVLVEGRLSDGECNSCQTPRCCFRSQTRSDRIAMPCLALWELLARTVTHTESQ